jgi:hypothetical protein
VLYVCLASGAGLLAQGALAAPVEVGGGGPKSTDCLTTFIADVNTPAVNPRNVTCTDGDPACDIDGGGGVVDGVCHIQLRVCANSTFSSSCSLNGVDTITVEHAADDGLDPKFDTSFQALQTRVESDLDLTDPAGSQLSDQCTNLATIEVPIRYPLGARDSCGPKTKRVRLITQSKLFSGRSYRDVDTMRLKCVPASGNVCDPQTLFTGTFDRVQRQIFNQSCAVGTCHDSQSHVQAGNLLLETGSSLGNTINVQPVNGSAMGAGWRRIAITTPDVLGDPEASYLYHKIKGDLPDATYGARMPYKRAKLPASIIEIMRLWILAGAPQTGWVSGTD